MLEHLRTQAMFDLQFDMRSGGSPRSGQWMDKEVVEETLSHGCLAMLKMGSV